MSLSESACRSSRNYSFVILRGMSMVTVGRTRANRKNPSRIRQYRETVVAGTDEEGGMPSPLTADEANLLAGASLSASSVLGLPEQLGQPTSAIAKGIYRPSFLHLSKVSATIHGTEHSASVFAGRLSREKKHRQQRWGRFRQNR